MSQENVEIARRAYAALNDAYETGDFMPFTEEFFDPEVVLNPSGLLPETGTVHGHAGVLGFTQRQAEAFERLSVRPQEMIDAGHDRLVVPLRLVGQARKTGLPLEFSLVHVTTIRNGKAVRVDVLTQMADARRAARLSE